MKTKSQLFLKLNYFQEDVSFLLQGIATILAFGFEMQVLKWILLGLFILQTISAIEAKIKLSLHNKKGIQNG